MESADDNHVIIDCEVLSHLPVAFTRFQQGSSMVWKPMHDDAFQLLIHTKHANCTCGMPPKQFLKKIIPSEIEFESELSIFVIV